MQILNRRKHHQPSGGLGWEAAVAVSSVGDAIVSTEGSLVEAGHGGYSTSTVNGVEFTSTTSRDDFTSVYADSSLYGDGVIGSGFETIMDSFIWSGSSPSGITFSGLSIGDTYLLQVFVSDDRTAPIQAREQSYEIAGHTSANVQNGLSYSIICRLVATATSHELSITSSASAPNINGWQIRNVT